MHKFSRIGTKFNWFFNGNTAVYNRKQFILSTNSIVRYNHESKNAVVNERHGTKTKYNFAEMITSRRAEAQQSILVQVNSAKSFQELYSYCTQFGDINGAYHYVQDEMHFILIEFCNRTAAQEAIKQSTYNGDIDGICVQSPFLWFRAASKTVPPSSKNRDRTVDRELNTVNGTYVCTDIELTDLLHTAETIDDQILILHRSSCLNDLGYRMRFLAARQIEESLSGMFPDAKAYPFGSSVNGYGKLGCDLDLVLRLGDDKKCEPSRRLVFHSKESLSNGRSQTQRYMENLSDTMHLFLPGISHVRRILQARIPIIKYHHDHLDLEVDLSMSNLSGVYMSELLFMFGQIDERVQPLVFAVRKWAQSVGLTNPSPGRWITNFSLTCLVISFLQQLKEPILPSVNMLCKQARPQDTVIIDNTINCTFLRDIHQLQFTTSNQSSLQQLLMEFFEFYSQLELNDFAISLNNAKLHTKPDHSAMYIVNPLETELNVSKNVSLEECERFRIEVRNAAWILESNVSKSEENTNGSWGILNLFKRGQHATIRPSMFFRPRMVDVSELFNGNEQSEDGTTQQQRQQPQQQQQQQQVKTIQYRNNYIRKEVTKIKKKGRTDIQGFRDDPFKEHNRIQKR